MGSRRVLWLLFAALSLVVAEHVVAAEIRALFTESLRPIMEEAVPKFEAATGHTVVRSYGTVGPLVKRVQDGERADVIAGPRAGIDTLDKESRLVHGSVVTIAVSRLGVAQRAGTSKPDVSTPDALKRTLLLAKSITYIPADLGGATAPQILKAFEQMGIGDEVAKKTVFPQAVGGAALTEMVSSGKAELALGQIVDFTGRAGVEVVGPLPPDLQTPITVAAASLRGGNEELAALLLAFLRGADAGMVIKSKGMETP